MEEKQIKQKNKSTVLLLTAILFIPCIGLIALTKFTNLEVRYNNSNLFSSNNAFYSKSECRDESSIASNDCRWNFAKDNSTVFVAGDSQAVAALDAIIPAASSVQMNVVLGARKGCPFFDTTILMAPADKCYYVREQVWNERLHHVL